MTRGRKILYFYVYLDLLKKKTLSPGFRGQSCAWSSTLSVAGLRKSIKDKKLWYYNDLKKMIPVKQKNVMGKGGTLSCWHGLALHGTYYNFSKSPRISLRYLIELTKIKKTHHF